MLSFTNQDPWSRRRLRVALALVTGAATLACSLIGCTSCESWDRDQYVALGGVTRTFAVPIAQGESGARYQCTGSAVGMDVDAWTYNVGWRAPTGVPSGVELSFRLIYSSNSWDSHEYSGACDGGACTSLRFGGYGGECSSAGHCETPTEVGVEVIVGNPSAIPPGGLATELVVEVGLFAKVRADGGTLDQPQPPDADVMGVDVQVDCVRVVP